MFISIHLSLSGDLSFFLSFFLSIHLTMRLKIFSMLRPKSSITWLVLYTLNVVHISTFRIYLSIYLSNDRFKGLADFLRCLNLPHSLFSYFKFLYIGIFGLCNRRKRGGLNITCFNFIF